ncbi:MAG TPA: hypothetical protein PKW17_13720, partial [Smithellaceae bacterium]|nr:hypothetical protein [Smithellaceae bacterium]
MSNQSLKNTKFFQENNGRFKKGHHWRPPQNFRNKKWLIENYINKKRSMGEIASEFNVTEAAIRFWMVRYKIPRRNVSEARKLKKWGLSGKKNGMYG